MDGLRSIGEGEEIAEAEFPVADEPMMERPPSIGTAERRMHVRAYNHWVSLLGDRAFPAIGDIDPARDPDLGPYSVLIDFREDQEDPAIAFLGRALREEGGHDADITRLSEVPGRSLVSRLTDHHLEIIANRAPIGFEAEFVNRRGRHAMYRGILMPLSSDGETVDVIYGVINWKEAADGALQAGLSAEIAGSLATPPRPAPTAPVWADGPGRGTRGAADPADALADRLAAARMMAETVRGADQRSRAALYRALGLAYDFAVAAGEDPVGYARLLARSGIKAQARAPMTPVAKLVFGANYDKTRLTEFAAALAHGRRHDVPAGEFAEKLEALPGGLKAVVAAERAARRPVAEAPLDPRAALREREALATAAIGVEEEFVLVVARRASSGKVDLIGTVADSALTERALRRLAA